MDYLPRVLLRPLGLGSTYFRASNGHSLSYIQEDIRRTSAHLLTAQYCSSCLIGDAATMVLFSLSEAKVFENERMVLVRLYSKEYGGRLCHLESSHFNIVRQVQKEMFYYCCFTIGSNGVCRCIAGLPCEASCASLPEASEVEDGFWLNELRLGEWPPQDGVENSTQTADLDG